MSAARRYGMLAMVIAVGGAGLAVYARMPHRAAVSHEAVAAAPQAAARVVVDARGVSEARVASGSDVTLTLANQRDTEVALDLAGYSDRIGVQHVPAHGSAVVRFHADRPGDDFAWMLDGQPAGRFVVTGSHLQEGHQ